MLSANFSILSLKMLGAEAPRVPVMGEERLTNTNIINIYYIISIVFINKYYLFIKITNIY